LAREVLADARILVSQDRYRSAANRIYYAISHSARALLTSLGIECKSHSGVISKFGECIVNENLTERKYGKYLNQAFNLRQKSDYQVIIEINETEIDELLKNAEEFIDEIEGIIKR